MEANKKTKKGKITEADRMAARKLKNYWLSIPADRRPTQEEIGSAGWPDSKNPQAIVGQYFNANQKLNVRAILLFSKALHCKPSDISDLPELRDTPAPAALRPNASQWPFTIPIARYEALSLDHQVEIEGELLKMIIRFESLGARTAPRPHRKRRSA